jgi:hypothetical protein
LKEYSYAKGEGKSLIFIDAVRFSEAFSLKGRYTKSGDKYAVDVRLFKGDEMVERFQVEDQQDRLAKKIVKEVNEAISH